MKNNHATKEINRKAMKDILDKGVIIAKEETNKKIYMDLEIAALDILDTNRPSRITVVGSLNNAIKKCKKQENILALEGLVIEAYQLAC